MTKAVQIMGILNVTPDSFSDGEKFVDLEKALAHALNMEEEGADIIDIGGESSRPGAQPTTLQTEEERILPVIRDLRKRSKIRISIDTTKAPIAAKAIEAGADMINDISAGRFDPGMFPLAAEAKIPICLMHMRGEPRTMQNNPRYDDTIGEVKVFLQERIAAAVEAGIHKENIIVDPGFGFGKRLEDNIVLLKNLEHLNDLGCPILIGTSRKSFIGYLSGADVQERLPGSLASIVVPLQKGATIFRVHDVAPTKQFLDVLLRCYT